jgi:hypothetical protein
MKDNIKSHIPKDTPHQHNTASHTPNYSTANSKLSNNSNFILNQNGVPCYNNIHIYTSGVNGLKPTDINLRQYIFSKGANNNIKKPMNINKTPVHTNNKSLIHARSNSSAGH